MLATKAGARRQYVHGTCFKQIGAYIDVLRLSTIVLHPNEKRSSQITTTSNILLSVLAQPPSMCPDPPRYASYNRNPVHTFIVLQGYSHLAVLDNFFGESERVALLSQLTSPNHDHAAGPPKVQGQTLHKRSCGPVHGSEALNNAPYCLLGLQRRQADVIAQGINA